MSNYRMMTLDGEESFASDHVTENAVLVNHPKTRAYDAGKAWESSLGVSGAPVASADASTAASVTDAPATDEKLVIDQLIVSVGAALTVTFKCETSGAVIVGPLYMAANTTLAIKLEGKVKLATANKKLQVQTSGAGNISVTALYHSEA